MNARHSLEQAAIFHPAAPDRTAREIEVLRHAAIRARDQAIADGVVRAFTSLGRGLAFLGRTLVIWSERSRTYDNLRNLTDRELADIGLTRGEISRVFEPDFRLPVATATKATVTMPAKAPVQTLAPANANRPRPSAAAA
ncbi:DUF1127 domain-containing protein [Falsiroseomonas selenitidurans]|uniref:DUF1127 domain-containing protein n=1 Tax=Falsiroseomonas selenitidurans TaxID=2716335 RepID=A0ABX1E949_9PROT|nr:DUF1127 domain-containing protein [Falsiroseomonas selenitidurans]NKC33343.1 DUF1127 domain-containing protein [Falsiroseomonas selenitidurans]